MNLQGLINKVRSFTRDFNGSIFRENDVIDFLYEAIDRVRERVPELDKMVYPPDKQTEIALMPNQYHNLLSIYSASRCMFQDEQDYRAGTLMNEFETKLEEMVGRIADGSITILDPATGQPIIPAYVEDAVKDVYFNTTPSTDNDYVDFIY